MAGTPRYLWGDTLMGYISLKPRSTAPAAKAGRMYFDSSQGFKFCADGTSYLMIRDVLHN